MEREHDPWEAAILAFVQPLTHVTARAILRDQFGMTDPAAWTMARCKRIGKILRAHGWEHAPWRDTTGQLVKGFQRTISGPLKDRRFRENKGVTAAPSPSPPRLPAQARSWALPTDPYCPRCRLPGTLDIRSWRRGTLLSEDTQCQCRQCGGVWWA